MNSKMRCPDCNNGKVGGLICDRCGGSGIGPPYPKPAKPKKQKRKKNGCGCGCFFWILLIAFLATSTWYGSLTERERQDFIQGNDYFRSR